MKMMLYKIMTDVVALSKHLIGVEIVDINRIATISTQLG